MNPGGDAAEQVVRMSLEGVEVAARITGTGAKNIAVLLAAVLKEEQKTKGKARLTSMLKSGKELKVFTVQQKDIKKFSQEAKRYGVLYCVLKDKNNKSENAIVDVIARADDASKIQRIMERFKLATVDKASVIGEIEKDRIFPDKERPVKEQLQKEAEKVSEKPLRKEEPSVNPSQARTGKEPPSGQSSKQTSRSDGSTGERSKPSVREKLQDYREKSEKQKGSKERSRSNSRSRSHKQPTKSKAR